MRGCSLREWGPESAEGRMATVKHALSGNSPGTDTAAEKPARGAGKGLRFQRYFTDGKKSPFDAVEWEKRTALIGNEKGVTIFRQEDVEVPKSWSQTATNIVTSKYFHGKSGTAQREGSVRQLILRAGPSRTFRGDRKSTRLNSSHDQISYAVFCLKKKNRLHFHAVHFMRTLPTGSVDPNFGRRVSNRRQLNSLQNTWPYGCSMPIAVRYTQDVFSRSGWLWSVDAKGEPLKATSYIAVGFYVAIYVNKKSDMDLAAKGLRAKEWNNSLKTKLSLLPKKLFRIRMSRNFGMKMLTMTNLSTECLIQLTKLGYDATPFNQILKQNAKREMRLRLGKVTVADVLAAQPVTTNLLKFMRASIKMIGVSNLQSFIASMTQKLTLSDISDESKNYLDKAGITTACLRIKSKWTAGGK